MHLLYVILYALIQAIISLSLFCDMGSTHRPIMAPDAFWIFQSATTSNTAGRIFIIHLDSSFEILLQRSTCKARKCQAAAQMVAAIRRRSFRRPELWLMPGPPVKAGMIGALYG
jgi:hypothetical protein